MTLRGCNVEITINFKNFYNVFGFNFWGLKDTLVEIISTYLISRHKLVWCLKTRSPHVRMHTACSGCSPPVWESSLPWVTCWPGWSHSCLNPQMHLIFWLQLQDSRGLAAAQFRASEFLSLLAFLSLVLWHLAVVLTREDRRVALSYHLEDDRKAAPKLFWVGTLLYQDA